jgi:hypothetical protein
MRKLWAFLFLIILMAGAYGGGWVWYAGQIKTQVTAFIEDTRQNYIQIALRDLQVNNFPFTPTVQASGRVEANGVIYDVPSLQIKSLFLNNALLEISLPQGLSIPSPSAMAIWSFDFLNLKTTIPASIPAGLYVEDMRAWQARNNVIPIHDFKIAKREFIMSGTGEFFLDENLQPAGVFQSNVTGHMGFVQTLAAEGVLSTREMLLATTVLSGLSQKSQDTGAQTISLTTMIENQTLYLGPLKVASLPSVRWPWRIATDRRL